jgi:hypothetical protein
LECDAPSSAFAEFDSVSPCIYNDRGIGAGVWLFRDRAMEQPGYAPEYLAGIRYFNDRDFFESHEVWEDVWNDCDPASRKFYQGLIQTAVALHHFGNGNLRGAVKLYHSSRAYLEPYRPVYGGLNVAHLLDEMARCFEALLASAEPDPDIEVDPELIPTLALDPPPAVE